MYDAGQGRLPNAYQYGDQLNHVKMLDYQACDALGESTSIHAFLLSTKQSMLYVICVIHYLDCQGWFMILNRYVYTTNIIMILAFMHVFLAFERAKEQLSPTMG